MTTVISSRVNRSYLFAPGHNAKLLHRVFTVGADAVILDLEDGVPAEAQGRGAGDGRRGDQASTPHWCGSTRRSTDVCAADLDAVAPHAAAIRIPKCESADDVAWVAARAPGLPIICAIETARGVLAAQEIAAAPGVAHLGIGGLDLLRDLYADRRRPADALRPSRTWWSSPGPRGSTRRSTASTR